jgi:hypothetical protein
MQLPAKRNVDFGAADTARSTSLRAVSLPARALALTPHAYQYAIRDSRIAMTSANNPLSPTTLCGRATHEWLFRLRFAQSRVAQLDLAPILAVFASKSVISTPPRFARDYSALATLAVFGNAPAANLRT